MWSICGHKSDEEGKLPHQHFRLFWSPLHDITLAEIKPPQMNTLTPQAHLAFVLSLLYFVTNLLILWELPINSSWTDDILAVTVSCTTRLNTADYFFVSKYVVCISLIWGGGFYHLFIFHKRSNREFNPSSVQLTQNTSRIKYCTFLLSLFDILEMNVFTHTVHITYRDDIFAYLVRLTLQVKCYHLSIILHVE